jgi:cohesin complex subunit SA-1/2
MEMVAAIASSPATGTDAHDADAARRRSGRVSKRPDLLVDQLGASAKRKRLTRDDENDAEAGAEDEDDEDDDDDEDDSSDDTDDDEEAKARKKRAAASRKATASKNGGATKSRAAKKPKRDGANGNEQTFPIRGNTKGRAKKAVRFSSAADAGGLFGKLMVGKIDLT